MKPTLNKLLDLLPGSWFSDIAKSQGGVLYALLAAFAQGLDYIELAAEYVRKQTRLSTATDENLDKISYDFFYTRLPRLSGESDDSYRARILAELFRDKQTRSALKIAIEATGARVVEIYEPFKDGFYTDFSYCDGTRISDDDPYEGIFFVTRPLNPVPFRILFTDWNYTDYNFLADDRSNIYQVADSDIYNVIESVKAYGCRVWVVLDPIPVSQATAPNYTSLTRYYIPAITGPGVPGGKFDEVKFDDALFY